MHPEEISIRDKVYDSIVIGAGPAGLSAAIYLGRFCRTVLVVDEKHGRSTWSQINENYLGFPYGIEARKLRELGHLQATKFGAEFVFESVTDLKKTDECYEVTTKQNIYCGKTIILATGVVDLFPKFKGVEDYIGKSLFWCITCDGYKTKRRKVVIVGKDDDTVTTCLQFLNFTDDLAVVLNCSEEECSITEDKHSLLRKYGIPFYAGKIIKVNGNKGVFESIELEDGRKVELEFMFNLQGAVPNSELAQRLGVEVNDYGYIKVNSEQRTNIPFVFAAGDVTKLHSHQIVTAAHEGSMAAQCANYDLYSSDQKH